MTDYVQFVGACLAVEPLAVPSGRLFDISTHLMREPMIVSRYEPMLQAWWATNPFADLDTSDDGDPNAPDIQFEQPDFYMQIANSMTRAEHLKLRKKYLGI